MHLGVTSCSFSGSWFPLLSGFEASVRSLVVPKPSEYDMFTCSVLGEFFILFSYSGGGGLSVNEDWNAGFKQCTLEVFSIFLSIQVLLSGLCVVLNVS